jgi:serine protease
VVAKLAISRRGRVAAVLSGVIALAAPGIASAAGYVPGRLIVGLRDAPQATTQLARRMGIRLPATASTTSPTGTGATTTTPTAHLIRLPRGVSVTSAATRLRRLPGVAYAVPDFIAHAAGGWIPNDPGRGTTAQGWEQLQWNLMPASGVDAPTAWANLFAVHHPGGKGTVVAILDTGVAYRNWHQYRRSPDFGRTRFVAPYDFVSGNGYPLDREGHGTFVAGEVAESTNNGIGLTGLAYGAAIMPVRILDADGDGDAATIARGLRYAVNHGANVINLSLEFDPGISAANIPDILAALRYAYDHGVVVVAAAGNEGVDEIPYPAQAATVISVGATTIDRCLASYSNTGPRVDVVAPGGGGDTDLLDDVTCHPGRRLANIAQITLLNRHNPRRFGIPRWHGTSMSAAEVTAAAALVIASGVIGRHPTPSAVLTRLEQTAEPLGTARPNDNYGWGLINAGAATAPAPVTPAP